MDVLCDIQSCISIAHDVCYSVKAKHIELQLLVIQYYVSLSEIDLKYLSGKINAADIFMKSLVSSAFHNYLLLL